MGREVTVDIMVPLTVRIDLDEGYASLDEAWLHLGCFQDAPRGRGKLSFDRSDGTEDEAYIYFRDVFFSGDWPDDVEGQEVCDGEHPLADYAFAIVNRYRVQRPEFPVTLVVDTDERIEREILAARDRAEEWLHRSEDKQEGAL